ncbi:MAG: UvrD-helicase domain-containing protein [Spirochaetia bacterium]
MQMSPAQQSAVDEKRNTVVLAGAGSGKTRVLAERYLRLVVQDQIPVRSILTLTFTRKAAMEMYERIYAGLAAHSEDEFVRRELERFDEATIATLDSFCSEIAASAAPEFGLPPSFTVDPAAVSRLAEEGSLEFLREKASHPALKRLIAEQGVDGALHGCFVPLATQLMSPARPSDFNEIHSLQMSTLDEDISRARAVVAELLYAVSCIDGPASPSLSRLIETADRLRSDPVWGTSACSVAALARATSELEAFSGLRGRQKGVAADSYKELQPVLKQERESLAEALATLELQPRLSELFGLFSELQTRVLERKRSRAVLSYHDVVLLAVEALRRSPELRSHYKKKFRALLIDEFQDNDPLQKELLYLLSERDDLTVDRIPRADELETSKLFFVGDDKQSIYRFRGADVAVFRTLAEELQAAGGVILELAANYRSEPELVEFCNQVFPAVMEAAGSRREPWEAEFRPLASRAATPGIKPEISVYAYDASHDTSDDEGSGESDVAGDDDQPAAADDAEAYFVASSISEGICSGRWSVVAEDGTIRPAEYQDIAILMRSGSNQIRYERLLRRFGVPYNSGDVRSLFLEAPSYDIYHLLQLVLYPEESLSYAAVLRGPLVALSDEAMVRELLEFSGTPFGVNRHNGEDGRRFASGAEMYSALREKAGRAPVSELLEDIWYAYGYRYYLIADSDYHPYLEYYDYLFALAAADPTQTLWEFLAVVRENLGDYKKFEDASILREEESGVQLLTIHRSKGLQFPIVFLANTGNKGRNSDGGAPCYISERFGPCLRLRSGVRLHDEGAANYFYRRAKDEEDAKDTAELKRLLYVALTRAQYHLIVTGVMNKRGANTGNCHLLMLQHAQVPLKQIAPVTRKHLLSAAARYGGSHGFSRAVEDLPEPEAVVRRPAERYAFAVSELNAMYREAVSGPRADEDRSVRELHPALDTLLHRHGLEAAFGTYVHALLELALDSPATAGGPAPSGTAVEQDELVSNQLFSGLAESERSLVHAEAATAVETFLGSFLGVQAMGDNERETELAFVYRAECPYEHIMLSGSIDLTFRHAGKRVVIDYKSDTEENPEHYLVQLELYRRAAQEIFGEAPDVFLFYLRTGREHFVISEPKLPEQALRTVLG